MRGARLAACGIADGPHRWSAAPAFDDIEEIAQ
jgi:hypothetical protein